MPSAKAGKEFNLPQHNSVGVLQLTVGSSKHTNGIISLRKPAATNLLLDRLPHAEEKRAGDG